MVRELCIENALFLEDLKRAIDKHEKGLIISGSISGTLEHQDTSPLLRKTLMKIYRKYVVEGSPYQLNITCYLVDIVKKKLDSKEEVGFEVYDEVVREVHAMLYANTFQRFVVRISAKPLVKTIQ